MAVKSDKGMRAELSLAAHTRDQTFALQDSERSVSVALSHQACMALCAILLADAPGKSSYLWNCREARRVRAEAIAAGNAQLETQLETAQLETLPQPHSSLSQPCTPQKDHQKSRRLSPPHPTPPPSLKFTNVPTGFLSSGYVSSGYVSSGP